MSSAVKLGIGAAVAALLYLPIQQPGLAQDATLQELFVQQATFAEMPQDAANPNAYLTPRKASARPQIEIVDVGASRTPIDRLLGIRSYAVSLRYHAGGEERCARFRLEWSASAERWGTRNLKGGSCSSWF
jgi:hypothetical protein